MESVTNMYYMFYSAADFNQDISDWDGLFSLFNELSSESDE
tara:strand:- start:123 stop:245 length:123 start_codon:yes stop_codon:yes gene_type:complete